MRKLILALLLALVCAAPVTMTSCALIQQQYEDLHAMEQSKFDALLVKVERYAKLGGEQIAERIADPEIRRYVVSVLDVALRQDTKAAFIEFLDAMKIVPEYDKYIIPALSAALDLVEAATGVPFSLDAHVHPRDLALIRAMLRGLKAGFTNNSLVIITVTSE